MRKCTTTKNTNNGNLVYDQQLKNISECLQVNFLPIYLANFLMCGSLPLDCIGWPIASQCLLYNIFSHLCSKQINIEQKRAFESNCTSTWKFLRTCGVCLDLICCIWTNHSLMDCQHQITKGLLFTYVYIYTYMHYAIFKCNKHTFPFIPLPNGQLFKVVNNWSL